MYNHVLFISYWLVNGFVLYIFNMLFGQDVVLGNWKLSIGESAVYAGFWVTFLIWSFWDFAIAKGVKFDTKFFTTAYFWAINSFSFWLAARFSGYTGLGVVNFMLPIYMGLVAHFVQRFVRILVIRGNEN